MWVKMWVNFATGLSAVIHPQKRLDMPLTDSACRNAKPAKKLYKLADSEGLCLRVTPEGGKYWVLRYRFDGKQKDLSLGVYPSTPLQEARQKRDNAKKLLKEGNDPSVMKVITRKSSLISSRTNFKQVAEEWLAVWGAGVSPRYKGLVKSRLEKDIFPEIGKIPIDMVSTPQFLNAIRHVQQRGAIETGVRLRQACEAIFRFARASGVTKNNPAQDIQDALVTPKTGHFSAIEASDLPKFLQKLSDQSLGIGIETRCAIRLLMLTFVRTAELLNARWDEIDLENATWVIQGERTKKQRDHIVPLSRQACDILKLLRQMTKGEYVLPGRHGHQKTLCNNAILAGLYRMGYKGKMTGHGFRALAMSTIKEKLGYRHEVVDRQLAHVPGNKVTAAYDRAKFLEDRRKMMQEYADYIEKVDADNRK
jgi:integrase